MVITPLPSWGLKDGQNYVTSAFSGVPGKKEKITNGHITSLFSRGGKWAEWLCNIRVLVPRKSAVATSLVPSQSPKRGMQWLHNHCVFGITQKGDRKSPCWATEEKPLDVGSKVYNAF